MKRNNERTPAAIFCCITIILLSLTGCYGGSRGHVRFDELKYPASMSSYLYGPDNEILARNLDLIVIKRFRFEVYYPAVFYSLVPPSATNDVGRQINTEVENCGGDGVVNLKISSNLGLTTYFHPLTLLPFWPSYTTVVVEGDIVRYEPSMPRNSPKTEALNITDDVLIIGTTDETATVQLKEQCQVIGNIGALFVDNSFWRWRTTALSWNKMRPGDKDESGQKKTIEKHIRMAALERGANVAQIIYVTLVRKEVQARVDKALVKPSSFIEGALDIRYWSCPANQSQ